MSIMSEALREAGFNVTDVADVAESCLAMWKDGYLERWFWLLLLSSDQ